MSLSVRLHHLIDRVHDAIARFHARHAHHPRPAPADTFERSPQPRQAASDDPGLLPGPQPQRPASHGPRPVGQQLPQPLQGGAPPPPPQRQQGASASPGRQDAPQPEPLPVDPPRQGPATS